MEQQPGAGGADRLLARRFAIRVGLLYAAIFFVVGIQSPFLGPWLEARGLSPPEITLVLSAPLFVRIIATPAMAMLADRIADHRRTLVVLTLLSTGVIAAMGLSRGFVLLFSLSVLLAVTWSTVSPLVEALATEGIKRAGLDYGRMRLMGSLSFIVANLAGGAVIAWLGIGAAIWLVVAGAAATALSGALLVPLGQGGGHAHEMPSGEPRRPRASLDSALGLVRSPVFLIFLVAAGAVQGSHAMLYSLAGVHWQRLGYSSLAIGSLWCLCIVIEVWLFAYSGRVVERVGASRLIALGGLAAILRWTAMAFDPPLGVQAGLQLLHGLTFAGAHLGAIHFIARTVPGTETATAQAVYSVVNVGIFTGIAMALTGPLYRDVGALAYLPMAGLGAAGLAASLLLVRTERRAGAPGPSR